MLKETAITCCKYTYLTIHKFYIVSYSVNPKTELDADSGCIKTEDQAYADGNFKLEDSIEDHKDRADML